MSPLGWGISVSPVRYFKADQELEAQTFAEEGGIAIQQAADAYIVWGRRRRLSEWALAHGFSRHQLDLPIVTGVWHIDLVGDAARLVEAELGIGVTSSLEEADV